MKRESDSTEPGILTGQIVDSVRIDKSLGQFVCTSLTDLLKCVPKEFRRADRGWKRDSEPIHQLRVACRRALAALSFFDELLPADESAWFRKKLKSVLKVTRHARDLDVLLGESSASGGCSGPLLIRELRKQRSRCQKKISQLCDSMIESGRFRRRLKRFRKHLSEQPFPDREEKDSRDWLMQHMGTAAGSLLAAIPDEVQPAAIHRFRIQAKRLRYSADLAEACLEDARLQQLNGLLPGIQTQLGEIQDHVAALEELRESHLQVKGGGKNQLDRCQEYHQQQLESGLARCKEWLLSDECTALRETLASIAETRDLKSGDPAHRTDFHSASQP